MCADYHGQIQNWFSPGCCMEVQGADPLLEVMFFLDTRGIEATKAPPDKTQVRMTSPSAPGLFSHFKRWQPDRGTDESQSGSIHQVFKIVIHHWVCVTIVLISGSQQCLSNVHYDSKVLHLRSVRQYHGCSPILQRPLRNELQATNKLQWLVFIQ